ncbi:NADH-quinone oxidoreductase subunit NuoG [Candidatus Spongiihabitans sp.]|uniref:NADH-quinone oxidoreductase subunit NuoG n=1 Tax=Candidatus Spongiihabitans sp. TaxID=3101308 RepID=UPI003C7A81DD
MTTVTIEVDGKSLPAQAGEMLICVTDRNDIYIPRFCYHEKLSIAANCRMCLVEVAGAPKPLPACATPVMDGMKVFTQSKYAQAAQRGTMEFLLINHPLDCPVCDQGGECPLQDQAMGYGNDDSRFLEKKRAVPSHDIGPLVATEMTRCIHCTRCVRFGEEVAGVMEMGMPGRGESAYIGTFLNRSVDSEVSGNMIDLCPVGALTSKPYRFAARPWELQNHPGISPHDCVGANINIQTLRGRVERVLPRDNPQVNDCWLADRDRYSYEAVNSARRLGAPMIKSRGKWREVDWETALQHTADGMRAAIAGDGDQLGALAGYTSTMEEYYLLQKLARAYGCNNVDHRVQQCDFRDDAHAPPPVSELPIAQFDAVRAALLVGSNIRKEQPLLALRLRAATRKSNHGDGARIHCINPIQYPQNFAVESQTPVGEHMAACFAAVAVEVAKASGGALPGEIARWSGEARRKKRFYSPKQGPEQGVAMRRFEPGAIAQVIAQALVESAADGVVILGALAQQHQDASVLRAIARWICDATGNRLATLAPGNSVAAWRAGCLPHRGPGGAAVARAGHNAAAMFAQPRRAYLLLASEPELDALDGRAAAAALSAAKFVVSITAYQNAGALDYADVLLPMAAFTETAGAFVNCEGRVQHAAAATAPPRESRPAWKILRVLGNFLDLPGFDFVSLAQVSAELDAGGDIAAPAAWKIPVPRRAKRGNGDLRRLLDMPMYRGDQTVRNAAALQKTADNPPPAARMNRAMIDRLGLAAVEQVVVRNGDDFGGSATLPLQADERIPPDCVYVPAGFSETTALGAHGVVAVKAVSKAKRA